MNDASLTETLLEQKVVFPGKIIRLEHWQVRLPNGETALREVARHPGASAVVALDDEERIVLVRQHRIGRRAADAGDSRGQAGQPGGGPFVCAQRELSEETGLSAKCWRKLTCLETTPGFCDERIHIYLATQLAEGDCHPDDDEFVSVTRMPLRDAVQRVMDGTFRDGKTALAIMMASAALHSDHVNE